MTGACVAMGFSPGSSGGGPGSFSCSIDGGPFFASGAPINHTFSPNTVTIVGGTGPFTAQWFVASDANGTWSTGTGTTFTPVVTNAFLDETTSALYTCVVTDTATSATATSNGAAYTYFNTYGGIIP